MRIGVWLDIHGSSLERVRAAAADAAGAGYQSLWLGELGSGWDPLTLLTAIGPDSPGPELATAIVRTYPRHPLALAAQASSTHAAVGSRLVLGVGPAHAPIVESQYGMSFDRPAAHTREYLSALLPLLAGEAVDMDGERLTVRGQLDGLEASAPEVLLSALGPRMLRIAGELTAGAITTWAGPAMIGEELAPRLWSAAETAGRGHPRLVAQVAVCLTNQPERARQWVNDRFGQVGQLPSYRAVFEREGYASTADAVVIGDEVTITRALHRMADVGATDLLVTPVGPREDADRTLRAVPSLLGIR